MGKIVKGSFEEIRRQLIEQQNTYHQRQVKLPWLKKIALIDKLNEMQRVWEKTNK